jgi:hypothetical protein
MISSAMNAEGYLKAIEAGDHGAMEVELRRIMGGQSFLQR